MPKEAQVEWRGYQSSDEGVATTVDYKGPVEPIIKNLEKGIRSGLSYSGARSVRELQAKAQWLQQSNAGATESSAHIRLRWVEKVKKELGESENVYYICVDLLENPNKLEHYQKIFSEKTIFSYEDEKTLLKVNNFIP